MPKGNPAGYLPKPKKGKLPGKGKPGRKKKGKNPFAGALSKVKG